MLFIKSIEQRKDSGEPQSKSKKRDVKLLLQQIDAARTGGASPAPTQERGKAAVKWRELCFRSAACDT